MAVVVEVDEFGKCYWLEENSEEPMFLVLIWTGSGQKAEVVYNAEAASDCVELEDIAAVWAEWPKDQGPLMRWRTGDHGLCQCCQCW